ncbi:UNVERIFIED_CONTAM: hypothetical protein PYX00_011220 [Menopon gallinae]|uniref:serine-type D-Ala-D-Ala carboxypeptidase n=1 Tax=Menopon gallinae TaxID=328185 RepID=A0AAW2H6L7_9NEOP
MLRFYCFLVLICLICHNSYCLWVAYQPTEANEQYLREISKHTQAIYLLDLNTQSILWAYHEDIPLNPASMTKIVVLDMAYDWIEENKVDLQTLVPISQNADYRNSPPQSSLMFLQAGQKVTLLELLRGIAIPSGNDACVALAEYMRGSQEAFVEAMNEHVHRLGFQNMTFKDCSGYSPQNFVTAKEMALFTYQYIKKHPRALKELHSLRSFTYPLEANGGDKKLPFRICQENRNYLLGNYEGADGVKTGYIDEIGYNLAGTVLREGRRLLVVVMGIQAENSLQGAKKRAQLAQKLFDYAYDELQEVVLPIQVGTIAVLGGVKETAPVLLGEPIHLLFDKRESGHLNKILNLRGLKYLNAPLSTKKEIGEVSFFFKGKLIKTAPVYVEAVLGLASELAISQEEVLATLLGSCVSVVLWDSVNKRVGMNHFVNAQLLLNGGDKYEKYRYGDASIQELIELMRKKGSHLSDLSAKVIGAADMGSGTLLTAGEVIKKNVAIAMGVLTRYKIPIVAKDLGGDKARWLFAFPKSGRTLVWVNEEEASFGREYREI